MIAPPRNVLCSFHYFKDYDLDRLPHLRIIGDSGAFSAESQGAKITTADLAEWAAKWRHRLAWVASLDVIGDLEGTRRNWREMVEVHGIPGVPTVHFGADPRALDWFADRGVDFVGLGGMVGLQTAKQMRWLLTIFKYQQRAHPGMRFHGWGVTSEKVLRLPFYSVDSSGWTSAVRFARLILRDPNSPKDYAVHLNGRDVYRPEVARLLRDAYGVSFKDAAISAGANRNVIVRLAALSTAVQEDRARRLHGPIASPAWGMLDVGHRGPSIHLSTGNTYSAPERVEELHDDAGPHLTLVSTKNNYFVEVDQMHGPHLHMATAIIDNADPVNIENLNRSNGATVGQLLHLACVPKDGLLRELGDQGGDPE